MSVSKAVAALSIVLPIVSILGGGEVSAQNPSQTTQTSQTVPATVFQNVRVLDVRRGRITGPTAVTIRGNRIERIGAAVAEPGATVIDGGNRVLMPGLIDAHWHAMFAALPAQMALTADLSYIAFVAGAEAQATLMRGFTTIRDAGGPSIGMKRAIDEGLVVGPRIYPSGAFVSQTGGHGDSRFLYEIPRTPNSSLSYSELIGAAAIADGPAEVTRRVREQLMLGATQIKLMAGGGVSSQYDPIDVAQYTEAEFRAAVDAAENWGTYVMVHAYTPKAIRAAIAGGVKSIEHGQLIDEPTAKLMGEKGIWWSLQPFLDNEFANPQTGESRVKQKEVQSGTDAAYALAKKYKIKVAWGTDILFDSKNANNQGAILTTLTRWYTPAEILKMATMDNAELLALSGPRNPYPGKLGVVEEGALADLLLVDGDPIANIKLIADPERNFVVIMKDGKVYKNSLRAS